MTAYDYVKLEQENLVLRQENEELRKQLQQALAAVKVVEFNKGDADCTCPPIGQPG